jgi:prevent-host-death family protein
MAMTSMTLMTITVSVAEAKANLSELLRRAEAGEEILVARNGHPVARLSAVRPREGGFLHGEVIVHDPDWWAADDELAADFGT